MLAQGNQGSRVCGPNCELNSLVGASPAKSRQTLPQLSVPRVKDSLSVQPNSLKKQINQIHESLNQISGRAGRVNRIQRHDAARFLQIVCFGHFMRPAHAASLITKLPRSAGAPGRCNYLNGRNGRSGDQPESSKNRRPERLRFLCANAC